MEYLKMCLMYIYLFLKIAECFSQENFYNLSFYPSISVIGNNCLAAASTIFIIWLQQIILTFAITKQKAEVLSQSLISWNWQITST